MIKWKIYTHKWYEYEIMMTNDGKHYTFKHVLMTNVYYYEHDQSKTMNWKDCSIMLTKNDKMKNIHIKMIWIWWNDDEKLKTLSSLFLMTNVYYYKQ